MTEDERADEAFALLAEQPSLRSIVDDLCVEIRELRAQLNRIESAIQQPRRQDYYISTTGTNIL